MATPKLWQGGSYLWIFWGTFRSSNTFWSHYQYRSYEQDIQLVVSDPKACNNIVVKDQSIFEETHAFLECISFFWRICRHDFLTRVVQTCRFSVQRSFLRWVRTLSLNIMFGPLNYIIPSGDQHRKQRKLLNPVFNVNHMRYMIPTFHAIARQVRYWACIYGTLVK
jgi:cytochrome P450